MPWARFWLNRYGWLACLVVVMCVARGAAQTTQPAQGEDKLAGQPTSRPAPNPASQAALEKLRRLRDMQKEHPQDHEEQVRKEKAEQLRKAEAAKPAEGNLGAAREAAAEQARAAAAEREKNAARGIVPKAPQDSAAPDPQSLRERARAAAQRNRATPPPPIPGAPAPNPEGAPAGSGGSSTIPPEGSDGERPEAPALESPAVPPTGAPPASPALPPNNHPVPAPAHAAGAAPGAADEAIPEDFVGPPQRLGRVTRSGGPPPASHESPVTGAAPATEGGEPNEPALTRRPQDPNEPSEWFSFTEMPWENVIGYFVERIGKPLMDPDGTAVVGGTLTYVSNEKFTKDEAIDELNLILHEKGYRFVEREHHIYLVPLADMPQHVPLKSVYPTVDAFNEANPRDMDYVTVYYQVSDRPAQVYVDAFADALPDYSRISALAESNQIKITALAKDVRKFLTLKGMISISPEDPREIKFFEIKTNATAIERMVRDFLRMPAAAVPGQPQVRMVRDPRTGQMIAQPVMPGQGGADTSEVQMVADERTNSIIVKATHDKLIEIKNLIDQFDQKPDLGKFRTEVIAIHHADASEVANLVRDIIQQEQGQAANRTPNWQLQQMQQQQRLQQLQAMQAAQRNRRGARGPQPVIPQPQAMELANGASPEDIMMEGAYERAKKTIRLVADSRTNSLVVYANDDGFKRLREMLEIIDQPLPDKLRTITLQYADVSDIAQLVQQLVDGIVASSSSRPAPILVPDDQRNLFYVIAESDQMDKIEEIVRRLDLPGTEKARHIVRLQHLKPSVVAQMVQTLLTAETKSSGATSGGQINPAAAMRGRMGPRGAMPGMMPGGGAATAATADAFQVIALDEAQTLIVECTDDAWAKVEQTITMWDQEAITNTPRLETFTIERGDADAIASTLTNLYRSGFDHPILGRSNITIQADGEKVLVYAIEPAIDQVRTLIKQLDVERDSDKIEILPLANADVTAVAQQIQQLFAGGSPGGRGTPRLPGASPAPVIQAETVTNSLVVQADKNDLQKIKDFAMRLDQQVGANRQEKKFFTLNYAQPQEVAAAIQSYFAAGAGKIVRGAGGSVMQVTATAAGKQVIVEAPPEKMKEIETFIAQLDSEKGYKVDVKGFKLAGADVNQIAQSLTNAFQNRPPRPDKLQARFQADTTTEQIIVSAPPDMFTEIEALMREYQAGAEDLTLERKVYAIDNADATFVGSKIQNQIADEMRIRKGEIVARRLNIVVDERQNQVIVSAPKFIHPRIAELIAEFDKVDKRDVRQATIQLANADATTVVNTLRPIFQEKARQEQQNKSYIAVTLTPDTVTNSILVYGGDEADHVFVADEVARIDTQSAEQDVPPTTITVQYVDPAQVKQMIDAMFAGGSGKNAQKDVKVTVSNNTLVVKAPKRKLDEIQKLVADIDAKDDGGGVKIKTFDLKVMNATVVQLAVQGFLKDISKQAKPGQLKPGAFAEPTTNTLVVLAPPETMPLIETLVADLESKGPRPGVMRSYDLKNVRADAIATNVDALLKAKVAEREGVKKMSVQTSVVGLADTNRLIVYAPEDYQQLTAEMIKMVDQESQAGEVVQIVPLNDGDATQVAQSINALLQGKGAGKSGPGVRVAADPGSNSLIIAGLPKDVADVQKWATDLETSSVRVPELRTFMLKYAAPTKIKDMLESVFGSGGGKGAASQDSVTITKDEFKNQLVVTANRRKMRQVETYIEQLDVKPEQTEGGLFAGGKILRFVDVNRGDASDIAYDVRHLFPDEDEGGPSIESDWYGEYITVKCRESEFPQILSVIREYEKRARVEKKAVTKEIRDPRVIPYIQTQQNIEIVEPTEKPLPETLIEDLWKEGEEPAAVKEKRERADRNGDTNTVRPASQTPAAPVPPPAPPKPSTPRATTRPARNQDGGGSGGMPYKASLPIAGQVLDELEAETSTAPPARPVGRQAIARVVPVALGVEAASDRDANAHPTHDSSVSKTAPTSGTPAVRPALFDEPAPTTAPAPKPSAPPATAKPAEPNTPAPEAEGDHVPSPLPKEKVQFIQQANGQWVIKGPKDAVDDAIGKIDEISENLAVGEVIRIFRFKYGDVSAAAEILTLMFDVQQRQIPIPQVPQQPQQPQRGQQGKGEGKEGERDQGGLLEQMQKMVGGRDQQQKGQKGHSQLRIATDPGHNYLILRCDESQLPEIRRLLRELDIPPGEVQIKVFQLKNLQAEETADNIKDVLGISKAQSRRTGGAAPRGGMRPGMPGQNPQQAQLMEMLQQQLVSVPGVEGGAKVERVEIVPNATTNALMVSAPPEVMGLIERVINELEELEGRTVVGIYQYPLQRARVDDILPLLREVFEGASSGSGGGGRVRGGGGPGGFFRMPGMGGGSSPAALGPVTLSADPRVNTIIYTCEAKDVPVVEAHIKRLDIEGKVSDAEMYVCQYGDAEAIVSSLEPIFGGGSGRSGRGPVGEGATTGDVKLSADASTNTILVWGPLDKRDMVFARIEQLDKLSQSDFREIQVVHADADKLATTLSQLFAGGSGGGSTPGRPSGRRARLGGPLGGDSSVNVGAGGRVTILGDKNAKKLLVRAPDEVFKQIQAMAETLDLPSNDLQLKSFPLRYANAAAVVDSVKASLAEYLQLASQTGTSIDFGAFTAMPDTRTNSITVVGNEQIFGFVARVLSFVDVPTPPDAKKDFRIFTLDRSNATTVADAINAYAAGTGGASPGGGGRRGLPGGGAAGSGREVDVTAQADEATNTVMVFGRTEDIDRIETDVISKLEDTIASRMQIATIEVKHVPPSQLSGYITQFLDQPAGGATSGRGARGASGQERSTGARIVPNDDAKTLVVRGSQRQIDEIKNLVQRFDSPDFKDPSIRVIQVPTGQDATRLASEIERIVNQSEQTRADASGRQPRQVTVGADDYTNALIVAGDPAMYGMVQTLVDQLGQIRNEAAVTKFVSLRNLSAQSAEQLIRDLQQNRRGGASGGGASPVRRPSSGSTPSGGMRRSSSGSPSGGGLPQRPSGGQPNAPSRRSSPRGGDRPSAPPPMPAPPPKAAPSGPGTGGKGPGAWLTPDRMRFEDQSPAVGALLQPTVVATPLTPVLAAWSVSQIAADDAPPPAKKPAPRSARGAVAARAQQQKQDAASAPATKSAPAKAPPAKHETPAVPTTRPAAVQPVGKAPASPATREAMIHDIVEDVSDEAPTPTTLPAGLANEPLSGISGSLRGDVAATAIDTSTLMITGDASDVAFIEDVLRMMELSTHTALIRVFPLDQAKAPALAPIIDKVIKAQIQVKGRPGPGDEFSISAEGRSNSLIVAASDTLMERIADLILQLDVPKSEGFTDFKTVQLKYMRAAQAVQILKPQVDRINKMNDVPADSASSISAVDATNSILIIGTPKDAEDIQRLIEAIDVDVSDETTPQGKDRPGSFLSADVIIVNLKNAKADDVAKVLTDMIKEQQENARNAAGADKAGAPYVRKLKLRLTDGRELPELDLERPIKVIAEKGTNSLIIFSSKKNNEALEAIVGVFDTLPIGEETDVKAFALRHAGAETVAKLITDVFKDKAYLNRPADGTGNPPAGVLPPVPPGLAAKGLPYPLVVQFDARTNTIVIVGRHDAVVLAGGLIAELDRATADLGLKARVLELKRQQAAPLADKLKKLLDDRAKSVNGEKNLARDNVVIQPDERANALIVFATDDMYDLVEDLVLQLDGAKKFASVDVKYRALKHADAAKVQKIIDETFKSRQEAETKINKDAKDSLKVLADTRSNSLLLTGTPDYLDDAEDLITQLDKQYAPTVVFTARKVKLNSAPNIASLLNDMVDKAIKQQDSKLSGSPIHVTADPVTDTLLVAAAQEDLETLNRWIEILDRPSEVGRLTKIIPLRRAIAEDVQKAVQDIYKKQGGGGQGGQGGQIDITVTADKTTNAIVAFGPAALLNDVEEFVKQLDSVEPTKGTVVRIFKLEQAAAQDAGDLLNRILELRGGSVGGTGGSSGGGGAQTDEKGKQVMLIFQKEHPDLGLETLKALRSEIVVIADIRTNTLVITAPPASMPLMESLVASVDVPPQDAKIRVFHLHNGDAKQMVDMLEKLFERRTTAQSGGGGQGQSERVLTLGEGGGEGGGRQEVAFTTDTRTNSVIAAGTTGYLDLVEQMILDLDTLPIKDRITFVYEPRNITAQKLSDSLKSFSDAEKQRLQEIGQDVSTQVKQEREVVAIYNEDANRVIVGVDPRFQSEVRRVIDELDQQPLQVMIQVLILEVSIDNTLDLGVEFAAQDLQWTKAGTNDNTTFDYVAGTDIGAAGSGLGGFTFTITGRDFNFLVRTLQVEGNLSVLSRPQIVAMNNKEAKIDISNDVPYVNGTQTSTTGQIATSVARQKVGIILTVTPQINPDGFVRMDIDQQVSDLTDSTVAVAPGVTSPIFFTREAKTTITVRDNETVVLGGLITSRESNTETKVPLVGDIPILGTLFRTQNDESTRRELLLVMTPRVVRGVDEYRAESVAERDRLKLMWGDLLSNPLLDNLQVPVGQIEPPTAPAKHEPYTPPTEEPQPQHDLEPRPEEYGPIRPAVRARPVENDTTSYDVPVTLNAGDRH